MSIATVTPPAISSSDALFSFCPQSFPASGTFAMSQLFASGDQNTGTSASIWKLCEVPMLVAQSYLILCDPMYYRPPGSSDNGILQTRILEWVAIFFSRGSSWSKDQTQVSCTASRLFTIRATRKDPGLITFNFKFFLATLSGISQWKLHCELIMHQLTNIYWFWKAYFSALWASLVAQMVKNLPAMQETWVRSLGQEDLVEQGMATHSSILAWRVPWTEEPGGLQLIIKSLLSQLI